MISYQNTVNGDKNMPDYTKQTSLKVTWSHSSDAKANPNQSFTARVNFASQNYERSTTPSPIRNPREHRQSAIAAAYPKSA